MLILARCIIRMSKKKAFVLRVDPDKMETLEKWAADEFRSTNGQIEWILMKSLKEANRQPKNNTDKNDS